MREVERRLRGKGVEVDGRVSISQLRAFFNSGSIGEVAERLDLVERCLKKLPTVFVEALMTGNPRQPRSAGCSNSGDQCRKQTHPLSPSWLPRLLASSDPLCSAGAGHPPGITRVCDPAHWPRTRSGRAVRSDLGDYRLALHRGDATTPVNCGINAGTARPSRLRGSGSVTPVQQPSQ